MITKLYEKGLLFLKDLAEENGSDKGLYQEVLNTFFNGKYSEERFRVLKFLQRNGYIDTCFKLISVIISRAYEKFGSNKFLIRIDIDNANNVKLPPYVLTELYSEFESATICFKELVIPIFLDNDYMQNTLKVVKSIREEIGLWDCNTPTKLMRKIIDLFVPLFYLPDSDTDTPFVYIDASYSVEESYNEVGIFTTTLKSRIIRLGTNYYFEFIRGSILYYTKIINIKSPRSRELLGRIVLESGEVLNETTLLTEFQASRKEVLLWQEV